MMNSVDCAKFKNHNYLRYHFFCVKICIYVNYSCTNLSQTKTQKSIYSELRIDEYSLKHKFCFPSNGHSI